ncbi:MULTISPECIES: Uma2 family endonuclease [unclassified Nostoc]|uniref:Uma2 family endonuclease n=1 Tax=unclassified Nostoc TaxID=2593658 RepID=UPI002AD4E722|nr:Uma2 family endonuclease [Nostoc sp. DedQUE03]MDZ7971245.1 Uma2 family endonuclease [Nostoc sp. DedQUE03]MDZ8043532.1 Uma2 family endonuclease [Nostoc sp. DedQUE02]
MTSSPHYIPQSDPPLPPWETLPTMYDLPSDNPEEPGLPDDFHFLQPLLLYLTFQPINWNSELVYSAADLNLYYDLQHPLWYKRPDWFGVVGVEKLYKGQDLRLSYVTWQEPANPFVVVELLSPGTEDEDLGRKESAADKPPSKWEVYERILRIPYYVVFSRYTNELQAFHLVGGHYEPMNLTNGYLLMPEIDLSLGLWQGSFRDIEKLWLRWFTLAGELIPAPTEEAAAATERAMIAEQEAAQAKQETAQAKRKAEQLAERLRQLGVNPDELDELL